jgi:outer membrane protein TolC
MINAKLGGFYINKGYQFKTPGSVIKLDPQFVDLQSTALAQSQLSLQGVSAETIGQDNYLAALSATKSQIASNIQGLNVEEQVVDVTSKWTGTGSLDLVYPLYTGGKRRSYKKIQQMGIENAKTSNDQTVMDVVFDIKKIYYLSVLSKELLVIVDTLIDEMNVSLEIIEKLYKTDKNLEISKADYLKHKMAVEQIKLIKLQIERNKRDLSRALAFVIGIEENEGVVPKSLDLSEFSIIAVDLKDRNIEDNIISFNPDWKMLEKNISMQEENIKISKSEYYPTIALIGNLGFLENNKDLGNVLNIDERNYTIGLVMDIPIFNGFLTKKKIAEKKLEMLALKHQSMLVKDALKMEVVNILNQMSSISNEIKLEEDSYLLSL